MTATRSKLCFVLHAHLPFVAHATGGRMEERWFYEALTETYLPLLRLFDTLESKGSPYLAVSITPTLLAMMENEDLRDRYVKHLKQLIQLASQEKSRVHSDGRLFQLASFYHEFFSMTLEQYIKLDCQPVLALKALQDKGLIELMASAATHAFLPMMPTVEGIQSQIFTGIEAYRRSFGRSPKGFWLPECGYDTRVRDILRSAGIEWISLDAHAIDTPVGDLDVHLEPLDIGQGITAFIRNQSTSELVWNAQDGYPGDSVYREFYRDIGWDLGWESKEQWDYIRPFVLANGARIDTGIKYYQVTGKGTEKSLYDPYVAMQRTVVHARHFLDQCGLKAEQAVRVGIDHPVITAMYDAELFGHWWFEGIEWLRQVASAADEYGLELVSPGYTSSSSEKSGPVYELSMSTWGRGGYAEVWVNSKNHWMYRHLHAAERIFQRTISIVAEESGMKEHVCAAAEALALAQSSDWAFILDHDTVVSYALTRFSSHLADFYDHIEQVANLPIPSFSATREDVIEFPVGRLVPTGRITPFEKRLSHAASKPGVFMLTWEYPPNVVGGLGRSVSELAETLAKQGEIVHVITIARQDEPCLEFRHGVYIHRAKMPFTEPTVAFYDWVVLMNLALVDQALELVRHGCDISLIHGHDWLVSIAAEELARRVDIPLVMTIHATEWGRNQGRLSGELQKRIHEREFAFSQAADRVFVCSRAMKSEVCGLFQLPEEKVEIFRNGILPREDFLVQGSRRSVNRILFLGRLVYEKGVHTLLHAMRQVCAQISDVQLTIAGTGPMESELREIAAPIATHVDFLGFVGPMERDRLLAEAALTVVPSYYEPFGLVALEAMQAGCPVVVSDSGGLAELVVHMVDGRKAIPGDVHSLALQIVAALRDQPGSLHMAAHAQQKVGVEYSWDAYAAGIRKVYRQFGSQRSPQGETV